MHLVVLADGRINADTGEILFCCAFCNWTGSVHPVMGKARGVDARHSIVYGPDLLSDDEWHMVGVEPMPGVEIELSAGIRIAS